MIRLVVWIEVSTVQLEDVQRFFACGAIHKAFSLISIYSGFTDDVILNSRYAHIGDVWFNSKRMCFMEEYSRGNHHHTESFFNLREMELQISMWKEKSVQVGISRFLF